MIGAENIGGPIDQVEVLFFGHAVAVSSGFGQGQPALSSRESAAKGANGTAFPQEAFLNAAEFSQSGQN